MAKDSTEARFDPSALDKRSYHLGMIYAFAEAVASGCKRLALSPPLTRDELDAIVDDVRLIAGEYRVRLYVDEDFLESRLFNPEFTRGKLVILIAVDEETTEEYRELREAKRRHLREGTLTDGVEADIARRLGRLLSYSEEAIESLLENPRF